MTTEKAAEHLGVQPSRVRQLALAGTIPAKKFGRDWMFQRADLDAWKAARAEANAGKRGRPFKS